MACITAWRASQTAVRKLGMKPGITTGTGGHRPQHLCVQGRAGDLKGSDAGNSAGVKPEPGRLRSGQFFAEVQSNRRRLADAEAEEGWRVHKVQLEDTASWNFLKNYISDSKMALHTWMPPSLLPLPRPPSPPPLPRPATCFFILLGDAGYLGWGGGSPVDGACRVCNHLAGRDSCGQDGNTCMQTW